MTILNLAWGLWDLTSQVPHPRIFPRYGIAEIESYSFKEHAMGPEPLRQTNEEEHTPFPGSTLETGCILLKKVESGLIVPFLFEYFVCLCF